MYVYCLLADSKHKYCDKYQLLWIQSQDSWWWTVCLSETWRVSTCCFFLSFDLFLPSYCWCRYLLLHLITTNDTHFRWDSFGWGIGPSQIPLPDKTQDSQETDILTHRGIRTLNPSKRMAADLHHRPCGYWDWLLFFKTKYSYQYPILNAVSAT